MNWLLLLVSASALCILSASEFHQKPLEAEMAKKIKEAKFQESLDEIKNHDVKARKSKVEFHKITKRYADEEAECRATIRDELCNNGYYQERANFYHKCNLTTYASYIQTFCTPNSMGGYCDSNDVKYSLYYSFRRNCNISSFTCSRECEDVLRFSRYILGCCISSIFNNSMSYISEMFSYSLWSNCYVRPVTQECPPSTVSTPTVPRDPTCNTSDRDAYRQLYYLTLCKRRYIEPTISRISHIEGCSDDFPDDYGLGCEANRFGTYCNSISYNEFDSHFRTVSMRCGNSILCESLCREALQNITDTVGCCFIDKYSSYSGSGTQEWLGSDFWSMCDVEYPGNCQPRYTDDEFPVATVVSSLLVPTTITAIVAVVACAMIIAKKRSGMKHPRRSSSASETAPQDTEHVQEQDSEQDEHMYDRIQAKQKFEIHENVAYASGRKNE